MYDFIKALIGHLFMPLPIMVAVFVCGAILIRWGKIGLGNFLSLLAMIGLLLLSWGPVADRLLAPLEEQFAPLDALSVDSEIHGVVVLGGGWSPWLNASDVGRLNDSSAIRLMEGMRIWQQHPNLLLIVSGTSRRESIAPIAEGYARVAKGFGVPTDQLLLLDRPSDTRQEAQAVREALGEGARVVIVTSASHMPRSMHHFRLAGLNPLAAPTHYLAGHDSRATLGYWIPASRHLRKSERALYEWLGWVAAQWEAP
ncbi:ElyC/SanA/YdcF family protein [Halomonas sp. KM-1]|uniref:ElyC/SanA/YdcF family protein n=1 Tax=Halomonas sp. KM-1 TaxID=590061 RepID=UPI00028A2229|nr:ElyC/SanA/YdcF family protein [Halomonas sp. KM-1]